MKYQVLFSLKNHEKKIFKTVVCCCHDWHFKVIILGIGTKVTEQLVQYI